MNVLIKQAVVFAGGRGSRLGSLTESEPKPMMDVAGKPFLYHLLDNLRRQGISEIVLLTGYLKERIRQYFDRNPITGITLKYSEGPEEWDTGERLVNAEPLLADNFLLLYSDNYSIVDLSKLTKEFSSSTSSIQLLVAEKKSGNIAVNSKGLVTKYDRSKSDLNCTYVEIGFMLCRKERVFELLEIGENQSFSTVIERLVEKNVVSAVISEHPYLSISDPERLEVTREYFRPKKILLVDRDGTINKKHETSRYITSLSNLEFVPGLFEAVSTLAQHSYSFILVTNQAGVATGDIRKADLDEIHNHITKQFLARGANLLDIFVSTDHWSDGQSNRRKPAPGMFIEASIKHRLLLDQSVYIGDDPRDMKAAERAGCKGIYLAESEKDLEKVELSDYFKAQQLHVAKNWAAICNTVLSMAKE